MQTPDPNIVALWYHYEEIAMHFNSLIMQFRLQVIAGAGAIGTTASYLINEKVRDPKAQARLRAQISAGLWVLILCAAILDLFYYNALLQGAVNGLLDFERNHPQIQFSTQIENAVGGGKFTVWWVYGILLGALLIYSGSMWRVYLKEYGFTSSKRK